MQSSKLLHSEFTVVAKKLKLMDEEAQAVELKARAIDGRIEELTEGEKSDGKEGAVGRKKSWEESRRKRKAPTSPGLVTGSRVAKSLMLMSVVRLEMMSHGMGAFFMICKEASLQREWTTDNSPESAPTHGNKSRIAHDGSGSKYVELVDLITKIGSETKDQATPLDCQAENPT
jgi:hypothetical protein